MKNLKYPFCILLIFNLLNCSSSDLNNELEKEMEEEIIDGNFFLATDAINVDRDKLLYDTLSNRIYLIQSEGETKILCYDYKNMEVISEAIIPTVIEDHNYEIGRYNGEIEIYIGNGNKIEIYNGDDLTFKERIIGTGTINAMQFQTPNLIFTGGCNSDQGTHGTKAYNRATKKFISNGANSDPCIGIISFRYPSRDTIGVISSGYNTNNTKLTLDKFDSEGKILDSKTVRATSTSWQFLRKGNHPDYFISKWSGQLISKIDLSLIGGIAPAFSKDIITNQDGSKIFAIDDDKLIKVFDYPSLKQTKRIELNEVTINNTFPASANRFFIDEEKLMILTYRKPNTMTETYILKLDLPLE